MKPIVFTRHALVQMQERGATQEEVELSIGTGEPEPAKLGRQAFRKNFSFEEMWKGRYYTVKQVMSVVAEEQDSLFVVTVYVFYFGGNHEN